MRARALAYDSVHASIACLVAGDLLTVREVSRHANARISIRRQQHGLDVLARR